MRTLTQNTTGKVFKDVKLVIDSFYKVYKSDPVRGGYKFEFQFPTNEYTASKGEPGVVYLSKGNITYTLELLFTHDSSEFTY